MATRKPMEEVGSVCLDLGCWRVSVGSTGKAMEIKNRSRRGRKGESGGGGIGCAAPTVHPWYCVRGDVQYSLYGSAQNCL